MGNRVRSFLVLALAVTLGVGLSNCNRSSSRSKTSPVPGIASLTPSSGGVAGGISVAIVVQNFTDDFTMTPPTSVTFGGNPGSITGTPASDTLTVTTPPAPGGNPGFVDVVLTAQNAQTATRANAFEYLTSPGNLQFSSAAYQVLESGGSITITVTRTNGVGNAVSVDYATSDGTATAPADYTSASGPLNWLAGDGADKSFTVDIFNDSVVEGGETVNLTLSNSTGGATLGTPNTAVLTILDDDYVGTVWAWGENAFGALGDGGMPTDSSTPVQVVDASDPSGYLTEVDGLAAYNHSLAVRADGTVRAWGFNDGGQLGDGTQTSRSTAIQVLDPPGFLTNVTAVAAGERFSVALLASGFVRVWGVNQDGPFGDGTEIDSFTPVQAGGGIAGVTGIAAGWRHTVAHVGGSVWAWGYGIDGQLGDGACATSLIPVQVVDPPGFLAGVTAVAAGSDHSVALLGNGTIRAWGDNSNGQLGDGNQSFVCTAGTPVQVVDPGDPSGFLQNVTAIAAAGRFTMALLGDGTVRAWGDNSWGQLGDGTTTERWSLVQVIDLPGFLTGVVAIAAGANHSVAVKSDGTVRTWGWNSQGQLGDGTNGDSSLPVQVVDPLDPSGFLTGVTAVAAGTGHTLASKQ
ncbi:MAG: IPT/TIG domain-containing protein [Planctomycetota bacterium]|nr:IPT/TIG domain-containing protein [Planctomycetota bacterium]